MPRTCRFRESQLPPPSRRAITSRRPFPYRPGSLPSTRDRRTSRGDLRSFVEVSFLQRKEYPPPGKRNRDFSLLAQGRALPSHVVLLSLLGLLQLNELMVSAVAFLSLPRRQSGGLSLFRGTPSRIGNRKSRSQSKYPPT